MASVNTECIAKRTKLVLNFGFSRNTTDLHLKTIPVYRRSVILEALSNEGLSGGNVVEEARGYTVIVECWKKSKKKTPT